MVAQTTLSRLEASYSTINLRKNSSKASIVKLTSLQLTTHNAMDKLKEPTKSSNKILPIRTSPKQDTKGLWKTDEGQLVIPTVDLRRMAMEACHDSVFSGHFGPTRTINLVQRLFYWPEMAHHIRTYCNKCNICQQTKSSNQKPFGQLRPLPVPRNK
jgi:hypothetical protein